MKNLVLKVILLILVIIFIVQGKNIYDVVPQNEIENSITVTTTPVKDKNDKIILSDILVQLYSLKEPLQIDNITKDELNTKVDIDLECKENLDSILQLVSELRTNKYFKTINEITEDDKQVKKISITYAI